MSRPLKKWPHYAEWARLDALAALEESDKAFCDVLRLLGEGHKLEAMLAAKDGRLAIARGRLALVQAKHAQED